MWAQPAGAITADGTLGILIAPSVMLIVMGPWSACRSRR
jgi:TRAP-type mannitol/chloroaromatic compound transport system permease large subunit